MSAENTIPAARNALADKLFRSGTMVSAGVVFAAVVSILVALAVGAAPALQKFGPGFLVSSEWNPPPNSSNPATKSL